jgi:hypothetical protein
VIRTSAITPSAMIPPMRPRSRLRALISSDDDSVSAGAAAGLRADMSAERENSHLRP